MSQMGKDLILILPQIIILITAVIALILEMLRKPGASLWSVVAGMLIAGGLSLSRLGLEDTAFSQTFRIDQLNHWAVIILSISNVLFVFLARAELKGTDREGTVYSLLTFSTLGAVILAGSGDLMFIVLGILLVGLSGFALAAYAKTDPATEGAMKYFIYGSVTGAIMTFGLTYWVGMTGSTLISELNHSALPGWAFSFGFIALLIGIGYAASIFPFHFWTPDTFEGAPVSIASYLSVTPKIGAIFALAQVAKDLPLQTFNWPLIIALLAFLSMTFGNVMALLQQNVVRLLAYSTVAQAGYFLIAIVAIPASGLAIEALTVFGAAYAIMNTGAFALVLNFGTTIDALRGLGREKPLAGIAMTLFLFSLLGIPPLAGFAGKFLLFGAALDADYNWLAIAAIINSVISLGVYLRIIIPLFFRQSLEFIPLHRSGWLKFVWLICLALIILLGLGVQVIL
ncbi:MAG: NADH-quinone oxidoreductase subunit N [Candidatus Cyclobacteriaceae bacterium M3_2C_046]